MAKVDAKMTQALVVTFKSLVKENELPKNASNLPFFGDVVKKLRQRAGRILPTSP